MRSPSSLCSVQDSEKNGVGSPQRLVALFHARSSGYDLLTSHKGPVIVTSFIWERSLRYKKQTLLFLQETRVMTYLGNSREERQGRGKCSELSCLEVGVGWVRNILILTLRVSLEWSNVWSTLTLSAWIYNPCASYKGTQQTPELMFGCWLTRVCRLLAKHFWQKRQLAGRVQ